MSANFDLNCRNSTDPTLTFTLALKPGDGTRRPDLRPLQLTEQTQQALRRLIGNTQ
jgi:hypothetical protein